MSLPFPPRVLLTSSDPDAAAPEDVSRCGAAGFVPKTDLPGVALEQLLARQHRDC